MVDSDLKKLTVEEYIATVLAVVLLLFNELRQLVKTTLPYAKDVYNYSFVAKNIKRNYCYFATIKSRLVRNEKTS